MTEFLDSVKINSQVYRFSLASGTVEHSLRLQVPSKAPEGSAHAVNNNAAIARPRRSLLYVPATNSKAISKARSLNCDCIILDLEDSVAPSAKEAAREGAVRPFEREISIDPARMTR